VYWWICSWRGLIYIFQELYRRVLGRWPLPVFHPFNPKVERNSQVILDDNYILLSCCSTTCFHSILISFRGPMYRKNKKAHHDLKRRRIWSLKFVVHVPIAASCMYPHWANERKRSRLSCRFISRMCLAYRVRQMSFENSLLPLALNDLKLTWVNIDFERGKCSN
jgi:hypothetical protein